MRVLLEHIEDLKKLGYLHDNVNTEFMTYSISGATNELALNYAQHEESACDDLIISTISHLVDGFRKRN